MADRTDRPGRKRTTLGDQRESAVPCVGCADKTWNLVPLCDTCQDANEARASA